MVARLTSIATALAKRSQTDGGGDSIACVLTTPASRRCCLASRVEARTLSRIWSSLLLGEGRNAAAEPSGRRGGLDFDPPKVKVILAADDPRLVVTVKRSRADALVRRAYQMIEDAMLAANEIAEFCRAQSGRSVARCIRRRDGTADALGPSWRRAGVPLDPEAATEPLAPDFLEQIKGESRVSARCPTWCCGRSTQ